MKKIASFEVDHTKLDKGVYVSRVEKLGVESVTTFDLRMKRPNHEVANYEGDIPGVSEVECDTYKLHSLLEAKSVASDYLEVLINSGYDNLNYPA